MIFATKERKAHKEPEANYKRTRQRATIWICGMEPQTSDPTESYGTEARHEVAYIH